MEFAASLTGPEAIRNRREAGKLVRFPQEGDARHRLGLLFPDVSPGFRISRGQRILTMGSCFAREIEEELSDFDLPTNMLSFPPDIVGGRPNSVINEYNPGSMSQRIRWAVDQVDTRAFTQCVSGSEEASVDLLLAKGKPIPIDAVMTVRSLIDTMYKQLPGADALILTLGMTEAWYDRESDMFLNRIPDLREIMKQENRYEMVRLTVDEVKTLLVGALEKAFAKGLKNAIITVSPVPLQSTFHFRDCVMANEVSKSTLRCASADIVNHFEGRVDYFPSYEIVRSGGLSAFRPDNIHVRREVVGQIVQYMTSLYIR